MAATTTYSGGVTSLAAAQANFSRFVWQQQFCQQADCAAAAADAVHAGERPRDVLPIGAELRLNHRHADRRNQESRQLADQPRPYAAQGVIWQVGEHGGDTGESNRFGYSLVPGWPANNWGVNLGP